MYHQVIDTKGNTTMLVIVSSWVKYLVLFTIIEASSGCDAGLGEISWSTSAPGTVFRRFHGISLYECLRKCKTRPGCVAVGYNRLKLRCDVSSDVGPTVVAVGHTFSTLEHWGSRCRIMDVVFQDACEALSCSTVETCNHHDNDTYTCDVKECKSPGTIANGQVLGTEVREGSRIKYVCDPGYDLLGDKYAFCNKGQWIPGVPTCILAITTTSSPVPTTTTSTTTLPSTTTTITTSPSPITTTTTTLPTTTTTTTLPPTTTTTTLPPITTTTTLPSTTTTTTTTLSPTTTTLPPTTTTTTTLPPTTTTTTTTLPPTTTTTTTTLPPSTTTTTTTLPPTTTTLSPTTTTTTTSPPTTTTTTTLPPTTTTTTTTLPPTTTTTTTLPPSTTTTTTTLPPPPTTTTLPPTTTTTTSPPTSTTTTLPPTTTTTTATTTATPFPGPPRSCSDLHLCNPAYTTDGEYWLYPSVYEDTQRVKVYCANMSTGEPSEFITLPNTNEFHYDGSWSVLEYPTCTYDNRAGDRNTIFNKMAINIIDMSVKQDDYSFTVNIIDQEEDGPMLYGSAGECTFASACLPRLGYFTIDTKSTGLIIDPSLAWTSWGFSVVIDSLTRSQNDQVITANCGGYCGYCIPDSTMFLHHRENLPLTEALMYSCV